jgi:hypothetical protein
LSQFAGGENGGGTSDGQALDFLVWQRNSQLMIRLSEMGSEKFIALPPLSWSRWIARQ